MPRVRRVAEFRIGLAEKTMRKKRVMAMKPAPAGGEVKTKAELFAGLFKDITSLDTERRACRWSHSH